jgi:Kinesin motor domain
MNSSRSHSLFQLVIESDEADDQGMLKRAKLNIGDLAGSEKIYLEEFPTA